MLGYSLPPTTSLVDNGVRERGGDMPVETEVEAWARGKRQRWGHE
jgi:hypothetical protein